MQPRTFLPAILAMLLVAAPGLIHQFIIGPGMLGHPGADDPSVGYDSVTLDLKLDPPSPEAAFAPGGSGVRLRPWLEPWYQLNQMPGV